LQQTLIYAVPFVGLLGWAAIPVFVQLREAALVAALKGQDLSQEVVRTSLLYTLAVQITQAIPRSAFTRAGTAVAARVLARAITSRVGTAFAIGAVRGALPAIYDIVTNGQAQAQRMEQLNMVLSTVRQATSPPVPEYQP